MTFSSLELEKIKSQVKDIQLSTVEMSEDTNILPEIRFHGADDILYSFYEYTKWQKKDWWIENFELLELLKKHLQQNINRRKLKEMDKND